MPGPVFVAPDSRLALVEPWGPVGQGDVRRGDARCGPVFVAEKFSFMRRSRENLVVNGSTAEPGVTPPSPDPCLVQSRKARFRGGTLIASDVVDVVQHERRLLDVDAYRPAACPTCGCAKLHVHDHLHRTVLGEQRAEIIRIVRYICANAACRATWRLLPAFVARHLWRRWATVRRAAAAPPNKPVPHVPARTRRRWAARLRSAARQILLMLAGHDDAFTAALASTLGFDSTRRELVDLLAATRALGGDAFAGLAAALHVLERGVRLV